MLGGERKWSTQSTNNFTGARNQQHGSLGNLCLTVPFLIACGRPNQERSSLPVLTVLLLLGGEHLVEGGRVERRGDGTSGVRTQGSFFVLCDRSTFFVLFRICVMDLLKACDEMKDFIGTAQKLVDTWDADPDNYSQLEEGLSALKAVLEKFKG